jgi:2-polyprenyl-6-methoxyphenol hydroxylase-like FAD-dependent oxidoreductase
MGWDENRAYDSIRCGVTSPSLGRPDMTTEEIYDVAIVGYGPVGQVLAALLGHQGHRVVVLERHHGIYPLPRAVRMDGEVQRVLQNVGSMDDIAHELLPVSQYTWFGADGDPILVIDIPPHPSGWPDVLFHQPTVETALRANVTAITNVDVKLGWIVEGVSQTAGDVAISATSDSGDATTIRARYAVGADGANSVVRQAASISQVDLGFSEFWLVVDIRPSDMADFDHLPTACQRCDPKRPVTIVGNGTHHRRWEFMLLPGETPEDFADPARVWELLGDVTGPDRAELVRHAVYNFRSLISESLQAFWPATPPTSCPRSWAKACAPVSGMPTTWRGSSILSCAASPLPMSFSPIRPSDYRLCTTRSMCLSRWARSRASSTQWPLQAVTL